MLIKLAFSRQIFEIYSHIKFHENPSSGSPVVPCGRMYRQTDRQTDKMQLIVAIHKFLERASKAKFIT
jgi:hypothetical protein